VQRIHEARHTADAEERELRDGDVTPACAQSCPTRAITFGDFDDPESRVSRLRHSRRAFQLLQHLGTEPGVVYLRGGLEVEETFGADPLAAEDGDE
jgi:molybdopterin-containing oxidoreductase family iron-sulfur binding subunit